MKKYKVSGIIELSFNETQAALSIVTVEQKPIVQVIYFSKGEATLKEIMGQISVDESQYMETLHSIGKINNILYKKLGVALFPVSPASTILGSKFILGKLED